MDRTLEFHRVAGVDEAAAEGRVGARAPRPSSPADGLFAEIGGSLRALARAIRETSLILDPTERIEGLVADIKTKIEAADRCTNEFGAMQPRQKQLREHHLAMSAAWRQTLVAHSLEFSKLLNARAQTLKAQQSRRAFLGATEHAVVEAIDHDAGSGGGGDDDFLLMIPDAATQVAKQRSAALRSVERTVHEISQLMAHIALVAQQQHEMITRIDDHVQLAESHLVGTLRALRQYMPKLAARRWLYVKMFAALFIFMVFFAMWM